jgi:hypothetical protein
MLRNVRITLDFSFDMSKVTNIRSLDEPSVSQFFNFETGVKNQLINVHRFQKPRAERRQSK